MKFTEISVALAEAKGHLKQLEDTNATLLQQMRVNRGHAICIGQAIHVIEQQYEKLKATQPVETVVKIGESYVAERDVQAAIASGIKTATEQLIEKINSAQSRPKK